MHRIRLTSFLLPISLVAAPPFCLPPAFVWSGSGQIRAHH